MIKNARYYRRLPYHRVAERVTDGNGSIYFVARVLEIPSIRIDGESREEALLKLDEIFDDFVEAMIQAGDEIPEPSHWPDWSETTVLAAPVGPEPQRVAGKLAVNVPVVMPQSTRPWEVTRSDGVLATA